ncbi:MAG: glutamate 5-kinase [Alphaproteobacteria bacterium]|nr:glutamate 5-kinase [Alphaproteobacteria bacterium]
MTPQRRASSASPALAQRAGSPLAKARRLVVKIGSALLVDDATGTLRRDWLDALADDIAALHARGVQVIVVSSGAIALGRLNLGLPPKNRMKLEQKQAAAAVGQIRLAHGWQESLARHGLSTAQLLLTLDDSEERRRYLNARATLTTLLALRAIPVINENDSVATTEIRFGDNDRLAARVAEMVAADALVLLSDIDGLYTADPRLDAGAEHIALVPELTPAILAMAGEALPGHSSGGMITKLAAARIAMQAGCRMAIARGSAMHPLRAMEEGARASWFLPVASARSAWKSWIAGSLKPAGRLRVDAGAAKALLSGRSLLPAGVTEVAGEFARGDAVTVEDQAGRALARGLANYAAEDARRILGRRSSEIAAILGWRGRDEMIHRDDLVLL